jgi:DNA-binding transcriptional MerR regulator
VSLPTPKNELAIPLQEIPDKLYFRIGEVSRLAGVKPYVLRYWETEFPVISPKKSGTGHRLYRRKDVELVLEIKRLLYDKRFTIEGARKALEGRAKPAPAAKGPARKSAPAVMTPQGELFGAPAPDLSAIRKGLLEILDLLR